MSTTATETKTSPPPGETESAPENAKRSIRFTTGYYFLVLFSPLLLGLSFVILGLLIILTGVLLILAAPAFLIIGPFFIPRNVSADDPTWGWKWILDRNVNDLRDWIRAKVIKGEYYLRGNISRQNLTPPARHEYLSSISRILAHVHPLLITGHLSALDAATTAVKMMEDDPLFNAGKGAVFTLEGTNELEASVMVSRGTNKRCAGVFLLKHVKNPVLFAKELLLRDNPQVERGRQHNCLSGPYAEKLAKGWGLDIVDSSYFFTEKRWEQHLRDLKNGKLATAEAFVDEEENLIDFADEKRTIPATKTENALSEKIASSGGYDFDVEEYLPKGTVGCVVLDNDGVIAAATSTGGLTNKVPGRIGDTPTPGAGFWAEEWEVEPSSTKLGSLGALKNSLADCLPIPNSSPKQTKPRRAVGLSGTGNGDYFLRLSACHNISSRCRFGNKSLRQAAREVCGPDGEMERAGYGTTEPQGAVIGIDEDGDVVMEMNCGGCFRGTVDENGRILVAAYADEPLESLSN
ncbi:hypothetical protein H072_6460 [Dactylellina haptotyla CBS 200.50]|uniref:Asparaginase n=1 Tax=Dactylellina haptotyla (strain CBS 200.50) TaxID=1284197 RepID=S8A9S9_DACHA|nr:hypothetical protein H072_6460 [Dactylellina haptotyla CBS 200.50]